MSAVDLSNYAEQEAHLVQGSRTLRQLLARMISHRTLILVGVALIVLGTSASLLQPWWIGRAIDEAIIPKDHDLLKRFVLVLLLMECIRVSAVIAHSYLFELLGQRVMLELRVALFSHLQRLPIAVFDRTPVGRLVTRVTNDVGAMAEMFSAGFVVMLGNILVVVGIVTWLIVLDWKLGLSAVAILPLLSWASVHFSRKLQAAYRAARTRLSALNAFLAENILGMRVVALFGRESEHLDRFKKVNRLYADSQFDSIRIYALFQPAITLASGIAMATVIAYGGWLTSENAIPVGVLVAFFSYVLSLFQPLREIADKWNTFVSGMTAAERIFAVLEWDPENGSPAVLESVSKPEIRGEIRFEGVWFAYSGENWVLRDFNCVIEPGQRVGVVGHTGAGKTTLISLLLRFYEPQRGRILIDGKDIQDYELRSLRAAFGMIQQDVFLFSGSVADNVFLGVNPDASVRERVTRSLSQFGLDRLLEESWMLQERGLNLSAGQRQMLAFSRAWAADPSIWILDEATANVDSDSERKLGSLLREAFAGRTSLTIAHRLSTVKTADRILVLHHGALVEEGTHSELMTRSGLYSRLYRYQEISGE